MKPDADWLEWSYDAYPRIEEEFQAALDASLAPRAPSLLYDLVANMQLPAGSVAADVGCGEGRHSLRLADRFRSTGGSISSPSPEG